MILNANNKDFVKYTEKYNIKSWGNTMEILDKETQLIAVGKLLEEMQKTEEYVKNWNASWWEQLLDAHCLP